MRHFSDIEITNSLSCSDAKSLYEKGVGRVIDLRCSPCSSSRPVEEAVVRRLDNFRISYAQRPMDAMTLESSRISEFRTFLSRGSEVVLLVTDIPAEIAREIYLQHEAMDYIDPEERYSAVA